MSKPDKAICCSFSVLIETATHGLGKWHFRRHREPEDPSLMAAAMRETHEEIGLSLANAEYLGALSHQEARPR